MAERINAAIADAMTARLLQVQRVGTGLRREIFAQLAVLESEIISTLKGHDPTEWALLIRRRREVQRLMDEEIDPLIVTRYEHIATLLDAALLRLATHEASSVRALVNSITGEETLEELPSDTALRRGAMEAFIPTPQRPTDFSTTGAEWWARTGEGLARRMGDSLLVGIALGETLAQLTVRVQGTSDNAFSDGLMAKARQDAATLIQTQVTNAVSEAHVALGNRNAQPALIAIHSSILDSHTGYICLGRHGLRYTIPAHEPINHSIPYLTGPPYHMHCRSTMIIGVRAGGPIPDASVTAWLKRRDTAYQEAVLGPTRARLWRAGRLTPRQLLEAATGRPLTLEELGA